MKRIGSYLVVLLAGILLGTWWSGRDSQETGGEEEKPAMVGRVRDGSGGAGQSMLGGGKKGEAAPEVAVDGRKEAEKWIKGLDKKKLTREQLEAYLAKEGRSAEALFAAGLYSWSEGWLREALEKEPNNPRTLFAVLNAEVGSREEQLEWAQRLMQEQPENAMGAYLYASRLLEEGDMAGAVAQLEAGRDLPELDAYWLPSQMAVEDMLRATGSSPTEAKLLSMMNTRASFISQLNELGMGLARRRDEVSAGEAEDMRILTAVMGMRLSSASEQGTIIADLAGTTMQWNSLNGLPADALSPYEGLTVGEAREYLKGREERIREATASMADFREAVVRFGPDILGEYVDRTRTMGELEAVIWLREKMDE